MTALGLVVAVPAVLAYNWLIRRNKSIMEDLAAFTNDLHGYLMSNGQVKPRMAGVGAGSAAPTRRGRRRAAARQQRAAAHRRHRTGAQADPDQRRPRLTRTGAGRSGARPVRPEVQRSRKRIRRWQSA